MNACIGCHSCEVACAEQNGLPAGTTWRRVGEIEGGDHPDAPGASTSRCRATTASSRRASKAARPTPTRSWPTASSPTTPTTASAASTARGTARTRCRRSSPTGASSPSATCASPGSSDGLDAGVRGRLPHPGHHRREGRRRRRGGPTTPPPTPRSCPSADLTLSTTRIELPARRARSRPYAASDWNLRPEHPHWPLVWLTLLSQLAVGGRAPPPRRRASGWPAAVLAAAALVGALVPPRPAGRGLQGAAQPAPLLAEPRGGAAVARTPRWPPLAVARPGAAPAGGRRRARRRLRLGPPLRRPRPPGLEHAR